MLNHHFSLLLCQIGTDIQAAAAGKSAEFRQPYLVALGHRRKPLQYFLIVGKVVVEAGKNVVEATDQLFKSHYVFVVHFAQVIQNFWEFMASEVYRVMPASSSKASVRSMVIYLKCKVIVGSI